MRAMPFDTTTFTVVPRGTVAPAAGSIEITTPVGTVSLNASWRAALRPTFASAADTWSYVAPGATGGTLRGSGPFDTVTSTADPLGSCGCVPAATAITAPAGTVSS